MRDAGYDPARLPPGQYLTEKWPVLHAGSVAAYVDLATWTLRVFGEVEEELELTWEQFNELPRTLEHAGHPLRHALVALRRAVRGRPLARAREARAARSRPRASRSPTPSTASRRTCRSRSSRTTTRCSRRTRDGEPLTPDHGYPLRLVVPGKYFWKSAKWLRGIELSSVDKPGFWERYGYHNDADPWQEQRYGF